jgi:hypothetical protein
MGTPRAAYARAYAPVRACPRPTRTRRTHPPRSELPPSAMRETVAEEQVKGEVEKEVTAMRALETIGFCLVVLAFWVGTLWVFIGAPLHRDRRKR